MKKTILLALAIVLLALVVLAPAASAYSTKTYYINPGNASVTVKCVMYYTDMGDYNKTYKYTFVTLGGGITSFKMYVADPIGYYGYPDIYWVCNPLTVNTTLKTLYKTIYFMAGENMHAATWGDWPWEYFWHDI